MANNRGLANRTVISNSIDKELYRKLKEYSAESDIPMSRMLDRAIKMLLESLNK